MGKTITVIFSIFGLLAVALALSIPAQFDEKLAPADPCPPEADRCVLPNCLCSATHPPGGLSGPNVPQIVYLTFDDAVAVENIDFYRSVLFDRRNPNGAHISATFFVSHEYTNYSMIHELWTLGHDIALHSITHVSNTGYWANLNESGWVAEMADQKAQLAHFAGIPPADVKGVRAPFLQVGGNPMYRALSSQNFEWDCSRPTQNNRIPGLWPYTNDFRSIQDCQINPCPDEAFPGFWTVPMVDLIGDDMFPCAMVDECTPVPDTQDKTYQLLHRNFQDHYTSASRAPFGVFTHAAWMVGPADRPEFAERRNGYIQFLDYLDTLDDVYIVGVSQALEWVRNPVSIVDIEVDGFPAWDDKNRANTCRFPRNCRYQNGTWERYMGSCIACPPHYPWLGNHLGANPTTLEY